MSAQPLSGSAGVVGHRAVPVVVVRAGEQDLADDLAITLGSVRVHRELSVPSACELEFVAPPAPGPFDLGVRLDVRVTGHETYLFNGSVVAVEDRFGADGVHRLRVRAHDAAHALRGSGSVRTHVDTDITGIARTLFADTGLSVHAGSDGPRWPRLLQRGESDLAFFGSVCRQAGLWWQVEGDRVDLLPMAGGSEVPPRLLTWGENLLEGTVTRSAVTSTASVTVVGWDPLTGVTVEGGAKADSDAASGGRTRGLAGAALAGSAAADALAEFTIGLETAAAGVLAAVAVGDPELRPGVTVTLDAPGTPGAATTHTSDRHVLTAVDHLVDDASGFVSVLSSAPLPVAAQDLTAEQPPPVTLGTVIAVDDPDHSGRVRVTLPAYADSETDWLPVLALGAGSDKGFDCQPDVGDLVLLTHAPGNPTAGIVLGGLHGDRAPDDGVGVDADGVRRYGIRTSDGQRFVLDRDTDGVLLENQAGSSVRIDQTGIVVHSAGELTLEAPGHAMRLRAASIDLEQA